MKLKKDSLWQMENEIVKDTRQFYIKNQILFTENTENAIRNAVRETFFRTKDMIELKPTKAQLKIF